MVTATTGLSLRMLGASTLDRKAHLRPKAVLADNLFHTLEPPQKSGVVFWEVEWLWFACQGGLTPSRMRGPFRWHVQRCLGSQRMLIRKKRVQKKEHTFDHLGHRNGIISTLQVTGCIIK